MINNIENQKHLKDRRPASLIKSKTRYQTDASVGRIRASFQNASQIQHLVMGVVKPEVCRTVAPMMYLATCHALLQHVISCFRRTMPSNALRIVVGSNLTI